MTWVFDDSDSDWKELLHLYKIAPLRNKNPEDLQVCFSNSHYKCFVFDSGEIIGAGRAFADRLDCSYICDVAVHPRCQGLGIGKAIIAKLVEFSASHRKIILYANPGERGFLSQAWLPANENRDGDLQKPPARN